MRFLYRIFSRLGSSQAPFLVSEGFSNLASISRKYSRFFIDSPLHVYGGEFILPVMLNTESCDSLHHYSGELQI
jgi:hypothetical protein